MRLQAARIGPTLRTLGIPAKQPVLAGPVFRARDTAELAFGADTVRVTDSLLADDYAGAKLDSVLAEHAIPSGVYSRGAASLPRGGHISLFWNVKPPDLI